MELWCILCNTTSCLGVKSWRRNSDFFFKQESLRTPWFEDACVNVPSVILVWPRCQNHVTFARSTWINGGYYGGYFSSGALTVVWFLRGFWFQSALRQTGCLMWSVKEPPTWLLSRHTPTQTHTGVPRLEIQMLTDVVTDCGWKTHRNTRITQINSGTFIQITQNPNTVE